MSYSFRDHTADIIVHITGKTLDDIYSEAGTALMDIMYGKSTGTGIQRTVSLKNSDPDTLLFDFLSELLFLSDSENIVFSSIVVSLSLPCLNATLDGEPFSPDRHAGGMEVKGISLSGLHIVKDEDGYTLDILFDV
ncbi:MAG: archease [Methanospirillaceae archaeon]|nr:archease [Methanospirillaceae archaeon]